MLDKKFSFGLTDKLQATVFDLWGIGKGNMQHDPSQDRSKDTLLEEIRINPHDSYALSKNTISTYSGDITAEHISPHV